MLMSRSHFRHLPVSGDAGRVGMLDITDVCRALIGPASPQHPTTATPGRGNPSGTARGQFSMQNTAMYTAGPTVAGKLTRPDSAGPGRVRRTGSGVTHRLDRRRACPDPTHY